MYLDENLLKILLKKAHKKNDTGVPCNKHVIAIGMDRRGKILDIKRNLPPDRIHFPEPFLRKGTGKHAEERLMKDKYLKSQGLSSILVFRVLRKKKSTILANIEVCPKCRLIAKKANIKIMSLNEWQNENS